MAYNEDEYLQLSGIQHFRFCRRQWALIHIENLWAENVRTVDGELMHERAHDSGLREKRAGVIVTRDLAISSPTLGASGACDVVEFRKSADGIPLPGEEGRFRPYPVEYKHGSPRAALRAGDVSGRNALLRYPKGRAVFRRNAAPGRGRVHAGAAPGGDGYHEGNAQPLPARPYAEGEADEVLQCLFPERPVPAENVALRFREELPAETYGGNTMRRLLNTLFVTSEDAYLTLDGENIVVRREKEEAGRFPLHNLEEIVSFSYAGASPALMGACTKRNIGLSFCTPSGRFLARTAGVETGNVLLRREQYRVADDPAASCRIANLMIWGKLYNGRWSIERTKRDHKLRIDAERFENASAAIRDILPQVMEAGSLDSLRGLEGAAASVYFEVFDDMILRSKETFYYRGRNRRPPDNVNAMLSFSYSLLAGSCASALESVGLDAYVGFLHRDRPGRTSLALDLMEELRPCMADRFVLTLINNQVMRAEDFETAENGVVLMTDMGRRKFLKRWQERKQETITHPYLGEKLPWGLVPYMQALLLARYLRRDLDAYPPFLWK